MDAENSATMHNSLFHIRFLFDLHLSSKALDSDQMNTIMDSSSQIQIYPHAD